MEYKIGDTFYLEDGIKLEVVKSVLNCRGCYFFNDKDKSCNKTIDIICFAPRRKDKEFVIFKQIKDNNNIKKKITIDIYVVMQVHKTHRSFCDVFTSFEEANAKFETLYKHFKEVHRVTPKGWTTKSVPSQIRVSVIKDVTLYLYKETKEIEISEEVENSVVNEPEFKPFFCANNCFNESIKHTPFGILKDSTDKYYTILDISEDGISILSGNHSLSTISFKFASTFLKYVDGSSFGWLYEK